MTDQLPKSPLRMAAPVCTRLRHGVAVDEHSFVTAALLLDLAIRHFDRLEHRFRAYFFGFGSGLLRGRVLVTDLGKRLSNFEFRRPLLATIHASGASIRESFAAL